jgi:hypothetical protein
MLAWFRTTPSTRAAIYKEVVMSMEVVINMTVISKETVTIRAVISMTVINKTVSKVVIRREEALW